LLTGFLGVGGGFVIVPALVVALDLLTLPGHLRCGPESTPSRDPSLSGSMVRAR